jgi:hypothetical protein
MPESDNDHRLLAAELREAAQRCREEAKTCPTLERRAALEAEAEALEELADEADQI